MNTILLLVFTVLWFGSTFFIYYMYYEEYRRLAALGWIIFFICFIMVLYNGVAWVSKGDTIRANLYKQDNIIFLNKEQFQFEHSQFFPKVRKRVIPIEDGRDIEYYEIIQE